eukprot:scaffold2442_cov146-Cylindrotheca_fusiformis.AAC.7
MSQPPTLNEEKIPAKAAEEETNDPSEPSVEVTEVGIEEDQEEDPSNSSHHESTTGEPTQAQDQRPAPTTTASAAVAAPTANIEEDTTPPVEEEEVSREVVPPLVETTEEQQQLQQPTQSEITTTDNGPSINLRDEETKILQGAEILFSRNDNKHYNGWDNLRWMAYSGTRRLTYYESVYRLAETPKSFLAWASGEEYLGRKLAVYEEPSLILILRPPESMAELKQILDLEDETTAIDSSDSYLVVESVVDPNTCKLRLSPLTTVTSILPGVQENEFRRRSCFELITPLFTVTLSAIRLRSGGAVKTSFIDSGAFLETSSAEHVLKKAICNSHHHQKESGSAAINGHNLSWKHQIILGTLHSYVILGNKKMLDEGIAYARKVQQKELRKMGQPASASNVNFLDPRIVDALDESGKTPLHYACASRFTGAVLSLVAAGANVDLRVEPHQATPCHISAQKLDDKSLTAILAMNRRPNSVDAYGRTPMYVAITEGSAVADKADPKALDRCLKVLEAHDGDLGDLSTFRHPFSYLSMLMNHEVLSVVMDHVSHRYPLPRSNTKGQSGEVSVSAFFHYPIHSALIAFREKVKTLCEEKKSQGLWDFCAEADAKLVKTLEVLFCGGFEPNERLEGVLNVFNGSEQLTAYVGFAPIQILALAALDALEHKEALGETLFLGVIGLIGNVTELMVKNGARLTLDGPTPTRTRSASSSNGSITGEPRSSSNENLTAKSDALKISSNAELSDLLCGMERIKKAQSAWDAIKSVPAESGCFLFHSDKHAIEDSQAPGGSDEKSCAICWKVFGKLMNRKHRCRISRRHVCDECSTKRIVCDGEEHRVSDGQFLLAEAMKANTVSSKKTLPVVGSHQGNSSVKEKQRGSSTKKTPAKSVVESRLEKLEAEDQANRESLFGGFLDNATKVVFGEESGQDDKAQAQADGISGLSGQLNQTRDALNQRGDKLNTLAEKSDRLVNASEDFASMAKKLNRSTQGGFFW